MHQPSLDIFMRLAGDLDTEGRYLFLNALANQLRYPNNHTHYFSCILLYLFNETTQVGCTHTAAATTSSARCVLVQHHLTLVS